MSEADQLTSFVRTALADVPADDLGPCDAHEHLIIDPCYVTDQYPDLLLDSVERAAMELQEVYQLGGRAIVDTMPCAAGRNADKLAALARRTGLHIVIPTGLHLAKYYPPGHWQEAITTEALAAHFVDEIENGIAPLDKAVSLDSRPRAGVIKVAGSYERLTDNEKRNFDAAAAAQVQTGCPIITHTEAGTAAHEQLDRLEVGGASLGHVVLSHCDRQPEPAYHRELLERGAVLEYDAACRWRSDQPNHTIDLLETLLPTFAGQLTVGMDAARRQYWRRYGGSPGLAWLFNELPERLRQREVDESAIHSLFVDAPARAFAFHTRH
jgi:phosphotriesterase-related protein